MVENLSRTEKNPSLFNPKGKTPDLGILSWSEWIQIKKSQETYSKLELLLENSNEIASQEEKDNLHLDKPIFDLSPHGIQGKICESKKDGKIRHYLIYDNIPTKALRFKEDIDLTTIKQSLPKKDQVN
jgi:hypothetical protein